MQNAIDWDGKNGHDVLASPNNDKAHAHFSRVSVNSLEHVSWLNNSVMIDLSDFLELRNEVYHSDYFKSVDYTLTDFFQKFDVTEPDDDW